MIFREFGFLCFVASSQDLMMKSRMNLGFLSMFVRYLRSMKQARLFTILFLTAEGANIVLFFPSIYRSFSCGFNPSCLSVSMYPAIPRRRTTSSRCVLPVLIFRIGLHSQNCSPSDFTICTASSQFDLKHGTKTNPRMASKGLVNYSPWTHSRLQVACFSSLLVTRFANPFSSASGNWYPRDIGRSTVLSNGLILFQFGDTFCHNLKGDFLKVANNTCGIVQQSRDLRNPTVTQYLTQYGPNGRPVAFDGEGLVTNLIEKQIDETDTPTTRFKIWAFSGIVESGRHKGTDKVYGWTFYEMWKDNLIGGPTDVYQYTGVAEIISSNSHSHIHLTDNPTSEDHTLFFVSPQFC